MDVGKVRVEFWVDAREVKEVIMRGYLK